MLSLSFLSRGRKLRRGEEKKKKPFECSCFFCVSLCAPTGNFPAATHPLIPSSTRWSPPANLRRSASTSSEEAAPEGAPTTLDGIAWRRWLPIGGPGGFVPAATAGLAAAAAAGASSSFLAAARVATAAAEAGRDEEEEEGGGASPSSPVAVAFTFASSSASPAGCSCVLRLDTGARSEKKSSTSDIVGLCTPKTRGRRGVGSEKKARCRKREGGEDWGGGGEKAKTRKKKMKLGR